MIQEIIILAVTFGLPCCVGALLLWPEDKPTKERDGHEPTHR